MASVLAALALIVGVGVSTANADLIVMGDGGTSSASGTNRMRGNFVTVDTSATLDFIGLYLTDVGAGTYIGWVVYESSTLTGTYFKIHESSATVAGGDGFFDSGSISLTLDPGQFYFLGGFWDQAVTYMWGPSGDWPDFFDFGFGTMTFESGGGCSCGSGGAGLPDILSYGQFGPTASQYWQRYNIVPEEEPAVCSEDADCDDEDACTADSCDVGTDECSNETIVCDDGNVCNGTESCEPAVGCVEGTPLDCNDGNACTADSCDPATGCVNEDISGECDDGNACTIDSCDPASGACLNEPVICEEGQKCVNGKCVCDTNCPADFNGDGKVDAFDLAQLLGSWGKCGE